jgi:hypothetical protein
VTVDAFAATHVSVEIFRGGAKYRELPRHGDGFVTVREMKIFFLKSPLQFFQAAGRVEAGRERGGGIMNGKNA